MGSGRRVPIAGSPFRIDIQPAPLDPYNTRAFGRGVGGAEEALVVSELVKLRVSARDRFQVGFAVQISIHLCASWYARLVL